MSKYKVGDKVKIISIGKHFCGNEYFQHIAYKKAIITDILSFGQYRLDIDNGFFGWCEDELEPFESKMEGFLRKNAK